MLEYECCGCESVLGYVLVDHVVEVEAEVLYGSSHGFGEDGYEPFPSNRDSDED